MVLGQSGTQGVVDMVFRTASLSMVLVCSSITVLFSVGVVT